MSTLTHAPATPTSRAPRRALRPAPRPTTARRPAGQGSLPASQGTVGAAVAAACDAVADLDPRDPGWDAVGPLLTGFVDAARRAVDGSDSCIGAAEVVPAVLRLRELGRLAQMTATADVSATAEVTDRLRSLQTAVVQ